MPLAEFYTTVRQMVADLYTRVNNEDCSMSADKTDKTPADWWHQTELVAHFKKMKADRQKKYGV